MKSNKSLLSQEAFILDKNENNRGLKEVKYVLSDFDYNLPAEQIAQKPLPRGQARLLVLDGNQNSEIKCDQLIDYLKPDDLLVFNNTRVLPARLFVYKSTGGRIEIMLERLLDEQKILVQMRSNKTLKNGQIFYIDHQHIFELIGRQDNFFILKNISEFSTEQLLVKYGVMPLPPYINRAADTYDEECYQTVFASSPGAVAAPTAGLHFNEAMLSAIQEKGVGMAYITLHVGAGTFQPVRHEDVSQHQMHYEYIEVSPAVIDAVAATKAKGGRVIAVGTTVVRALESAARQGILQPFQGETNIFIHDDYHFKVIDGLMTNFHLPKSTLLMLVCAFMGHDRVMKAYNQAVAEKYRFFSYGDAMLLLP